MGRLIRYRGVLVVGAVLVAVLIGAMSVWSSFGEQAAETTAVEQAVPLDRLCQTVPAQAAEAGADCAQAAAIVRNGVDGIPGTAGEPGRGVLRTDITAAGRLIVVYDDGERADVGQVVGPAGEVGPDGRGVTVGVVGDRLTATYTDGEVVDLGRVVGADGRGVAGIDGSTGRLLVTFTDGAVIDAGPLPPGPQGPKGDDGAPAPSVEYQEFRFPDGSVTRCPRAGGPDSAPVFDCEESAPPPPPPTEGDTDPMPGG